MSRINEIMGRIEDALFSRLVIEQTDICEMVTTALAEARREGAEQMREAAAVMCRDAAIRLINKAQLIESEEADESVTMQSQAWKLMVVEDNIRTLPLPTGPRQVVRLTDAQLLAASGRVTPLTFVAERTYRAIETAVLAANRMGTK